MFPYFWQWRWLNSRHVLDTSYTSYTTWWFIIRGCGLQPWLFQWDKWGNVHLWPGFFYPLPIRGMKHQVHLHTESPWSSWYFPVAPLILLSPSGDWAGRAHQGWLWPSRSDRSIDAQPPLLEATLENHWSLRVPSRTPMNHGWFTTINLWWYLYVSNVSMFK